MGRVWAPRGQALGAVFNQLVRSRAQLLGAVVCVDRLYRTVRMESLYWEGGV